MLCLTQFCHLNSILNLILFKLEILKIKHSSDYEDKVKCLFLIRLSTLSQCSFLHFKLVFRTLNDILGLKYIYIYIYIYIYVCMYV